MVYCVLLDCLHLSVRPPQWQSQTRYVVQRTDGIRNIEQLILLITKCTTHLYYVSFTQGIFGGQYKLSIRDMALSTSGITAKT